MGKHRGGPDFGPLFRTGLVVFVLVILLLVLITTGVIKP